MPRLRGRFDVEGCERRHTQSAGLKGDHLDNAPIDLIPEQSQEALVVRKDDRLRSQAAELSDFDGGELAAKIVEAGERIVEHDNRLLQCRIGGDLGDKKCQRESKLVPAAQRVPEAGLVKRLGGAAGRNWYVVDKNLVAG